MMIFICNNTDLGDGWERIDESGEYAREFSIKKAIPLGTSAVFYALTHGSPKNPTTDTSR
jgi:hypothetical protein